MKKAVCIILLAFAVISCKDTLNKIEKETQGKRNADTAAAIKKDTPTPPKTEAQVTQEAAKLWMEKIAAGEWKDAYELPIKAEKYYLKFDTPVLKDGVITGECQYRRIFYENETIHFFRYTMLSTKLSCSEFEVQVIKFMENGVEQENPYAGKGIQFMKLFDGGKTLLKTDADPDSDTRNRSVHTEMYKQ